MTKRCADWADVNKLCVYNTTKKKIEKEKAAGATSFSRELLLFDVQMKPCAAPCYLASLKAMLLHSNCCAKKMIGSFYRDLEKEKSMLFTATASSSTEMLELQNEDGII